MSSLVKWGPNIFQTQLWPWGVTEIQTNKPTVKHMQKGEGINTFLRKIFTLDFSNLVFLW